MPTRRTVAAVTLVSAVAGGLAWQLARDGGEPAVQASCAVALEWAGNEYVPNARAPARLGRPLGTGTERACPSEDGGGEVVPARRREVFALRGIPATVAVGVRGDRAAYLAAGFLSVLRGHPFHDQFYGGPSRPARPTVRCGRRLELDAVVSITPSGNGLAVRRLDSGAEAGVDLHAGTRVVGFSRSGLPYLRRGDVVSLRGQLCGAPRDRRIVVDRVGPS